MMSKSCSLTNENNDGQIMHNSDNGEGDPPTQQLYDDQRRDLNPQHPGGEADICTSGTDSCEEKLDDSHLEPLLNRENVAEGINGDVVVKSEDKIKNLVIALTMTGFVFVAQSIYFDVFSQWIYKHYEKQVLGSNFSNLNISLTKDPCIDEKNASHRMYDKELNMAQELASTFLSRTAMISLFPAIATNILFGAYTDFIGRKVFFIAPILGFLVQYTLVWAVVYYSLDISILYFGYALSGLLGSNGALYMALFTYTADNTNETTGRTMGMTVTNAVAYSLNALSHVAIGYIISSFGYVWPMAAAAGLVFIGLLGVIFFLKETLHRRKDAPCLPFTEGVMTIFSFYLSKCPDPKHKRKDFLLLDLIFILYTISMGPNIRTLFLMNEPFCWNSKKIGQMETAVGLLQSYIPILVIKILQNRVSDEVLCIISLISATGMNLTFSIAQTNWMIYLALALSMMQNPCLPFVRSIMSKMVPGNKRGSLMTSLAVLEIATMAASGAGLNIFYAKTVHIWKGCTYFVIAICLIIAVFVMIAYIIMKKRRISNYRRLEDAASVNG